MDRLTERMGAGLSAFEDISFKVSNDKEGAYTIHDIAAMCVLSQDKDEQAEAYCILANVSERLADYEDIGLTPEQIREVDKLYSELCKELGAYKKLEEHGLLLMLPCRVGDIVYVIPSRVNYDLNVLNGHAENNRVYEQKVYAIQMFGNDRYLLTSCDGMCSVLSDTYRETWFLTRNEAEQALKRMGE